MGKKRAKAPSTFGMDIPTVLSAVLFTASRVLVGTGQIPQNTADLLTIFAMTVILTRITSALFFGGSTKKAKHKKKKKKHKKDKKVKKDKKGKKKGKKHAPDDNAEQSKKRKKKSAKAPNQGDHKSEDESQQVTNDVVDTKPPKKMNHKPVKIMVGQAAMAKRPSSKLKKQSEDLKYKGLAAKSNASKLTPQTKKSNKGEKDKQIEQDSKPKDKGTGEKTGQQKAPKTPVKSKQEDKSEIKAKRDEEEAVDKNNTPSKPAKAKDEVKDKDQSKQKEKLKEKPKEKETVKEKDDGLEKTSSDRESVQGERKPSLPRNESPVAAVLEEEKLPVAPVVTENEEEEKPLNKDDKKSRKKKTPPPLPARKSVPREEASPPTSDFQSEVHELIIGMSSRKPRRTQALLEKKPKEKMDSIRLKKKKGSSSDASSTSTKGSGKSKRSDKSRKMIEELMASSDEEGEERVGDAKDHEVPKRSSVRLSKRESLLLEKELKRLSAPKGEERDDTEQIESHKRDSSKRDSSKRDSSKRSGEVVEEKRRSQSSSRNSKSRTEEKENGLEDPSELEKLEKRLSQREGSEKRSSKKRGENGDIISTASLDKLEKRLSSRLEQEQQVEEKRSSSSSRSSKSRNKNRPDSKYEDEEEDEEDDSFNTEEDFEALMGKSTYSAEDDKHSRASSRGSRLSKSITKFFNFGRSSKKRSSKSQQD